MSGKTTRYKSIDKRILTEGEQLNFQLYIPNETKSVMGLFLQSDTVIDGNSKVHLREIEKLYINEKMLFTTKHTFNSISKRSLFLKIYLWTIKL